MPLLMSSGNQSGSLSFCNEKLFSLPAYFLFFFVPLVDTLARSGNGMARSGNRMARSGNGMARSGNGMAAHYS